MSQQNPLELAKQGNSNAIAALINRNLQAKGITAKVSTKGDCLRIMLEANEVPDQANAVKFIHNGIAKLAIANISKLQIFGRQIGDDVPAWSQTINLVTQQIQQSDKRQSSIEPKQDISKITIPEYVPTNRAFAITFGILGFLGSLMFLAIPLIGWVIGIFGIIGSLGFLANGLSGKGLLKGTCPYCSTEASAMEDQAGFDCKGCKKRILVKDKKFCQVE
jgi:DNA-directed RNA polymerase subunit RPC12/RpoP